MIDKITQWSTEAYGFVTHRITEWESFTVTEIALWTCAICVLLCASIALLQLIAKIVAYPFKKRRPLIDHEAASSFASGLLKEYEQDEKTFDLLRDMIDTLTCEIRQHSERATKLYTDLSNYAISTISGQAASIREVMKHVVDKVIEHSASTRTACMSELANTRTTLIDLVNKDRTDFKSLLNDTGARQSAQSGAAVEAMAEKLSELNNDPLVKALAALDVKLIAGLQTIESKISDLEHIDEDED